MQFVARRSVLDLRRVTIEPRRPDHLQSLAGKLRTQLRNDRRFGFAVAAPVRPEKQQHRRTFELRERRGLRAQKFVCFKRRRGLALKRKQVQIFLQARPDRSVAIGPQRGLQKRDSLRPLRRAPPAPATDLQCRSQRDRQMRFCIQRTLLKQLHARVFVCFA